jgi:hypothetical protein
MPGFRSRGAHPGCSANAKADTVIGQVTAFRALALVGVTGLALAASACGGSSGEGVGRVGTTDTTTTTGSDSSSSGSPNNSKRAALVAFSACMRKNGVPDFPDPDSEGRFRMREGSGSADLQLDAAARACKKFDPQGGEPSSPAGSAKLREQSLKFSRCMRSHGLPKFPDPNPNGSLIFRRGGPIDPESPRFKAAEKACQELLPGGLPPKELVPRPGTP